MLNPFLQYLLFCENSFSISEGITQKKDFTEVFLIILNAAI